MDIEELAWECAKKIHKSTAELGDVNKLSPLDMSTVIGMICSTIIMAHCRAATEMNPTFTFDEYLESMLCGIKDRTVTLMKEQP